MINWNSELVGGLAAGWMASLAKMGLWIMSAVINYALDVSNLR